VGLSAIAVKEFSDNSLRSEDDLHEQTRVPIVGRIPLMYTVQEERSRKLQRMVEVATVALFALLSLAVAVYTYRLG
jgi:hypothetical protein